ncbi:hypothetical protein F0Q45_11540 [Mycobacterium simiae]|uniref:Anti-sigma-D factor RsdA sigma factor binding region domain-containing protein n=1 Tax=Mycobacterium simiae TaxID=1784 RepID=A0A5B1BRZ4_MYCSI|nr:anti-sigma-D factor RsdA [Mycobacterium simiae]KAA1250103.1 hypothetical protein F0Q45_11540 [Mycobacterium simiae]
MREFGFDQLGVDDVSRTDLLLDALADRAEIDLDDPPDDALAALLAQWRDDLRWPPASALVSPEEAVEALIVGTAERRRSRRALAAVGSVAASLLALSGFGALVADARPGDALYGLHAMMFNEPRVSDDQIVLSAKADLAKAEQMIAQGQWDQAETQLAEVSSALQAVNDGSSRQNLLNELNQLNTKVEKRDPNATLPPSSPSQSELSAAETEPPVATSASVSESSTTSGATESTVPTSPVTSTSVTNDSTQRSTPTSKPNASPTSVMPTPTEPGSAPALAGEAG